MNTLRNPEPELARHISVGEVVKLYLRGDTSRPKDERRPYWLIFDVPETGDTSDLWFIAMPIYSQREEWNVEGGWPDRLDPAEWKTGMWPGTLTTGEHAFRSVGRLSIDAMIGKLRESNPDLLMSRAEPGNPEAEEEVRARYEKPAFILGGDSV